MNFKYILGKILKGFAFDIDNNLRTLNSKVWLEKLNGKWVEVSTADYAKFGKDLSLHGFRPIKDYKKSFVNFNEKSDNVFISDIMTSERAVSWDDFVECVNYASLFAWITARGHSIGAFQNAFRKMIKSNFDGLNFKMFVENQRHYMNILSIDNSNMTDDMILNYYINLCKFYAMENKKSCVEVLGKEECHDPTVFKPVAFKMFCDYLSREYTKIINMIDKDKKEILLRQGMHVGISDDDTKTVKFLAASVFQNERRDTDIEVHIYDTSNGKNKIHV